MKDGAVPCPYCQHEFSRTLKTQKTRRRRECTKCRRKFTTYERYAEHIWTKESYPNWRKDPEQMELPL